MLLAVTSLFLGCGDSTSESDETVRLTIHSARLEGMVGHVVPRTGNVFVVVDIEIENVGIPKAIPVGAALFTICGADSACSVMSLRLLPLLSGGCEADNTLLMGNRARCRVPFSISEKQSIVSVRYNGGEFGDHLAQVPLDKLYQPDTCAVVDGWNHTEDACANCWQGTSCKVWQILEGESKCRPCAEHCTLKGCKCRLDCYAKDNLLQCFGLLHSHYLCKIEACQDVCSMK